MPFVDLPALNLRQYYAINPTYSADADPSIKGDPPPSDERIDDAKPTLVFCHAGTSSSHSFIEVFNLVGFDTRYYGYTQGPRERADELLVAIDAVLGERRFSFVGESFVGSHIGVYVTAKRPRQVKSLILLSPSWPQDPPEFAATLSAEWMPLCAANKDGKGDGSGAIPEDAMAITEHFPERQKNFLKRYQEGHGPGEDMFKLEQLIHWFQRPLPSDDVFAAVRCPVLLLGGTRDQTVSSSDALQAWYDLLRNVPEDDRRIERIVDGPHLLALLESNRVNRFILAFLKRYELA
ncbi:A/B superfamily hydrolase [Rhodotorula taiwanensis]|uniref:A/B superfamily hydrolase n=1 Tax=Rhodotorula taiwanensis TaxID=741276 RepID=A0A2S5B2P0_9BASI|nr:A/B superfamily hydrolase [Rhodotorula taiwanensis]